MPGKHFYFNITGFLLAAVIAWIVFYQPAELDISNNPSNITLEDKFNKFSEEPLKGPELERWYFEQWHQPYGAVLSPDLLSSMRAEVNELPEESEIYNSPSLTGWELMGPSRMSVPGTNAFYTGRILDINLIDNNNLLIAAASGGLWKLNGTTATPLSDNLQDAAVSTIAVNPVAQNNIWVGTGEPFVRGGSGLYVTYDGGSNWTGVPGFSPTPWGFYKIRYMPGFNGEIHAATYNGYYKSQDGGVSWSKTLDGNICDFTFTNDSPPWIFAAKWGENKIYWSALFGGLWNEIALPFTNVGRVALSFQSGSLYAAIAKNDNNELHGVYKSTDYGQNWSNISPPQNYMGNQGWYDNIILTPSPNTIYVGGVTFWKSTNDGVSWTELDDPNLHVDHHAITFDQSTSELFVGNDGGLSRSTNGGTSWSSNSNRFPITQYVNIDVFSSNVGFIAGGSQDNGISITTDLGNSWVYATGGDGGGIAIDPLDKNKIFITQGVYGGDWTFRRLRTTDGGATWDHINNGIDPSNQWYHRIRHDQVSPIYIFNNSGPFVYYSNDNGDNWSKLNSTPFASDIAELTVAKWTSNGGTILYACMPTTSGVKLWQYDNGSWYNNRIPGDLPGDVWIKKVSTHPEDYNTAYIIMNGISQTGPSKKIYKTTNRGANWTNITGNLPNVPFSDVAAHPTNDNILIASSEFGCYRTDNGGLSWFKWSSGMPEAIIITELRMVNELSSTGKLFIVAGTYGRGVYARELNDGTISEITEDNEIPVEYKLTQNYPNPFNPTTSIRFSLPKKDNVELKVFDITGREVASLLNGSLNPGNHEVKFDATNLASGIYIYRIKTSRFVQSKKMTLLK